MNKIQTIAFLLAFNYFTITSAEQEFCKETEYPCNIVSEKFGTNKQCRPLSERESDLEPGYIVNCSENCTKNNYWCEPRGECISIKEVCDCGKDQLKCVSDREKKYICEQSNNILTSDIFEICPDGTCKVTGTCDKEYKECDMGTFMCGTKCKNMSDITTLRSCEGKCISVSETCYKEHDEQTLPTFLENIRSELGLGVPAMIGVSGVVGAGVVMFVGLCIFCLIRRKKKKNEIMWEETNSLYGDYQMGAVDEIVDRNVGYGYNDDGEMDDDVIVDQNPIYGYGD